MGLEIDGIERFYERILIGNNRHDGPGWETLGRRQAPRDKFMGGFFTQLWVHQHIPAMEPVPFVDLDVSHEVNAPGRAVVNPGSLVPTVDPESQSPL